MNTFLRDRRVHQALSAEAVAHRLDVHPMSVLRWERRERLPGPGHVLALASALELETTAVIGFFDEARPAAVPSGGLRGHGLRGLREVAEVPVRRLALRLDVLPATVYNWEAGRARIPAPHLPALAESLGLGVPELTERLHLAPVTHTARSVSDLRRLRRRTGLSQEVVASRIGASRHRIGAWERGDRPPIWAVRRMAVVYGVPVARVARAAGVTAPALLDRRNWSPGDLPLVLVALRQWSGLTQLELAERCGCHKTTVRSWERGRARPANRTRARLEGLHGLPPGELMRAYPVSGEIS